MRTASPRIGIFGGSFNPPHNGHVGACRYMVEQGLVDTMTVVPCWQHPYEKSLAAFDDRLAMCHAAFAHLPHVVVSEIERDLGGVSHTARTLRRLREIVPRARLVLLLGEDLLDELPQWKDGEAIRALADLVPIPRGPMSPIPNVSGTAIRAAVAAGRSIADAVPAAVAAYIAARELYRR